MKRIVTDLRVVRKYLIYILKLFVYPKSPSGILFLATIVRVNIEVLK
jgi:hypothetical protein